MFGPNTVRASEQNGNYEHLGTSGCIAQTDYPGKIGLSSVDPMAGDAQGERLLTSSEVARRAGVSRRTVASWVQQGILAPDFVTAGGHYRFRWSSVERQLREQRQRDE